MTAARQPEVAPAPVVLCGRCRAELRCPRCEAPSLVADLPPARLALTLREAAESLGVSIPTLREWELSRDLPVVRIGQTVRIPTAGLQAWLERESGR